MRITKIQVKRFKAIEEAEIVPEPINIIIGENNAGKSSFLQAIQFAVSVIQALSNKGVRRKEDELSSTLSFSELNYSPAKLVTSLRFGDDELTQSEERQIEINFFAEENDKKHECRVQVRRGKNSNLSVRIIGMRLFDYIATTHKNFSMYVPGLAGVPFDEPYQAMGAVRRAAARGDANTILRNVLLQLQDDLDKWIPFIQDVNWFFPDTAISVDGHLDDNGIIEVLVAHKGVKKSIETIGTGILQTIQICAYMHLFEPDILLLDEPDSHLHPVNQRLLGSLIANFAKEDRIILIATHSRHLLSSLREDAKIIVFKHGDESDYTSEYQILFDIGALDQYDVYRDPNIKYIYMIEDSSEISKRAHENLLIASGFDIKSVAFLPYNSSSKIETAIFTAEALLRFRSDLKIIIHSDRDGRSDEEIDALRQKFIDKSDIELFVTEESDVEMRYCSADHIAHIVKQKGKDVDRKEIDTLLDQSISTVDEKCLERYLNRIVDPLREGGGAAAMVGMRYYKEHPRICMNGHILSGEIIRRLHTTFGITKNDFYEPSSALCDNTLKSIINTAKNEKPLAG